MQTDRPITSKAVCHWWMVKNLMMFAEPVSYKLAVIKREQPTEVISFFLGLHLILLNYFLK